MSSQITENITKNVHWLDMLRSFVWAVSWPHLGHGIGWPRVYLNPLRRTWSSQKQIYTQWYKK